MMKTIRENRYVLFLPAVFFYSTHGGYILVTGAPSNLLWACHLGALVAGFGILFRLPSLNAIGVLWLGLGNIMWLLYLLGKGEFMVTSVLTHVGGLIIGIMGIYQMGIPRFSWIKALAALAVLQQLCRWITVEKENVNLAFRVHEGWEKIFPSYSWYLVVLLMTAGAVFFFMELLLRRIKVSRSTDSKVKTKAGGQKKFYLLIFYLISAKMHSMREYKCGWSEKRFPPRYHKNK